MGNRSGAPFVVVGMVEDKHVPHHLATPIPFLEDLTRSFDAAFADPAQEPDYPTHTRSEGESRPVQPDGEEDSFWEKELVDRLKLMGFSDPRPIVVPLPGRRVYLTRHYEGVFTDSWPEKTLARSIQARSARGCPSGSSSCSAIVFRRPIAWICIFDI
jgi:hypothetical protein